MWLRLCKEAEALKLSEPLLEEYIRLSILKWGSFSDALAAHLALRLAGERLSEEKMSELFREVFAKHPDILAIVEEDLQAVLERDPACEQILYPFLFFKGFQALLCHRIMHALWNVGRKEIALFLQSRVSEVFAVDIHPAARIGRGIMMDHATGVVIGETAVIEDNVSLLHAVTLGGTGKECGDRHPKIGRGVMIGAGAKVLGNIRVGECAKIGAGSVVLDPVPSHSSVAGVPAVVVGQVGCAEPAREMDQKL